MNATLKFCKFDIISKLMFRHKGSGRTHFHNLKLASILSGVAGTVNITSVLSVSTLTTNITGHFAFLSEEIFERNFNAAIIVLSYIFSFLLGAFISGLMTEIASRKKHYLSYVIPISLEISILLAAGLSQIFFPKILQEYPMLLSNALLFAMGLQNALVTKISDSVVRTTHLTGLFTDLGINLSQLFFIKGNDNDIKVKRSIFLKLAIITCFFLGGLIGGFLYIYFNLKTLLFPAALLLFALWYDRILFRYYSLKRKLRH
ncbi:YoaK family protein [Flavobacterium lindanitolerans]|uniref:YoaK family protein n=1 Tax=Flavobacterium lindanitolerans TaxID=428988 RepID=UPI0027BAF0D3|nr:YoaK family protein [Flavobacterium lindanitolerans]